MQGERAQNTATRAVTLAVALTLTLTPILTLAIFQSDKVSARAQQISNMVHEALEEAAGSSSPQNQAALYGAARDVLDLFRAIVVARHAKTLEQVPQLCAIFHNDCLYLAHQCLSLGHTYKGRLQAPLTHTATFVDMVPPFRQLGERYFSVQMMKQQLELTECLNCANGFTRLDNKDAYAAANKSMMKVRHLLTHLGRAWQEVLPTGLFLRSIGALIDHVGQLMLKEVAKLDDLEQVSIGHMADLVAILVQISRELLEGTHIPCNIANVVSCWPKLEAVAGLMEVMKAPEHYVHGARRGQLAVVLTNLNNAFIEEEPQEMVQRLVSYDKELCVTITQRMQELAS